ncbi:MAG: glycolate oxidase subunit GlcF [Mangrovicoccus sp.]
MKTNFTEAQLADPGVSRANEILRACVHCGFCTATCPTYQVLGDELDSPRGRIYLMKEMLETGRTPDAKTVQHIDRCLSCLSCMTTCPSGVHYMHLVDHARAHIEKTYQRPWLERMLRWSLRHILPYPGRMRAALVLAKIARPFRNLLPEPRIRAMLDMAAAPIAPPSPYDDPQIFEAQSEPRLRIAILPGCAQKALDANINAAMVRLLTRLGCEVVIAENLGCCGSLSHHMGDEAQSHASARQNILAWSALEKTKPVDYTVVSTSGCGTMMKDYGHMLRHDPIAKQAAELSAKTLDISELLSKLGIPAGLIRPERAAGLRVAYHAACSLQHGQKVKSEPKDLLKTVGVQVVEPRDSHLCCGSAGTYNLLQPEISAELKSRKVETLEATQPDIIVAGNIGCMMQIRSASQVPVMHLVELLDWITGGARPPSLKREIA